jgi:Raf kinase inhibitor-like YbhB/YbcL family protein
MIQKFLYSLLVVSVFIFNQADAQMKGGKVMEIKSPVFEQGEIIPKMYTCDGADVSPPLEWSSAPEGTKSFALICDDPDAPVGTWVHWVVYDLPGSTTKLPENIPPERTLADGGKQGITDFRRIGYGGPCPPSGTHRYFFKLYALDTTVDLDPGATKDQLLKAIQEHILSEAQLMGKYRR